MLKWSDRPRVAVDALILIDDKLVVVRRGHAPYKGRYALPGGFVEFGETTEQAVRREVLEETNLRTRVRSFVGVYSTPDRDPRGHTVSVAYEMKKVGGKLRSGSDAAAVRLFPLSRVPRLAFDHWKIVSDFKERIEAREY